MGQLDDKVGQQFRQVLRRMVPLAITLDSSMDLHVNKNTNYDEEIAKRLVYSFFANVATTYGQWKANLRGDDVSRSCVEVLLGLKERATCILGREATLSVLIDEPDKAHGAAKVLSALKDNAPNSGLKRINTLDNSLQRPCNEFANSKAHALPWGRAGATSAHASYDPETSQVSWHFDIDRSISPATRLVSWGYPEDRARNVERLESGGIDSVAVSEAIAFGDSLVIDQTVPQYVGNLAEAVAIVTDEDETETGFSSGSVSVSIAKKSESGPEMDKEGVEEDLSTSADGSWK